MALQRRMCCLAVGSAVSKTASSCQLLQGVPQLQRVVPPNVIPFQDSPYLVTRWGVRIKIQPLGPYMGHLWWATLIPELSVRLAKASSSLHWSWTAPSAQSCFSLFLSWVLFPNKHLEPQTSSQQLLLDNSICNTTPLFSRQLMGCSLNKESVLGN